MVDSFSSIFISNWEGDLPSSTFAVDILERRGGYGSLWLTILYACVRAGIEVCIHLSRHDGGEGYEDDGYGAGRGEYAVSD